MRHLFQFALVALKVAQVPSTGTSGWTRDRNLVGLSRVTVICCVVTLHTVCAQVDEQEAEIWILRVQLWHIWANCTERQVAFFVKLVLIQNSIMHWYDYYTVNPSSAVMSVAGCAPDPEVQQIARSQYLHNYNLYSAIYLTLNFICISNFRKKHVGSITYYVLDLSSEA